MTKIRTIDRLDALASAATTAAALDADEEGWAHRVNARTLRTVAARGSAAPPPTVQNQSRGTSTARVKANVVKRARKLSKGKRKRSLGVLRDVELDPPRLTFTRETQGMVVQIVDVDGLTLVGPVLGKGRGGMAMAGKLIAAEAIAKGVNEVVWGPTTNKDAERMKRVAKAARDAGLDVERSDG